MKQTLSHYNTASNSNCNSLSDCTEYVCVSERGREREYVNMSGVATNGHCSQSIYDSMSVCKVVWDK